MGFKYRFLQHQCDARAVWTLRYPTPDAQPWAFPYTIVDNKSSFHCVFTFSLIVQPIRCSRETSDVYFILLWNPQGRQLYIHPVNLHLPRASLPS